MNHKTKVFPHFMDLTTFLSRTDFKWYQTLSIFKWRWIVCMVVLGRPSDALGPLNAVIQLTVTDFFHLQNVKTTSNYLMSTKLLPFYNYNVFWQHYDLCTARAMFTQSERTSRPPSQSESIKNAYVTLPWNIFLRLFLSLEHSFRLQHSHLLWCILIA